MIISLFLSVYIIIFLLNKLRPLTLSWILLIYSVITSILLSLSNITWLFYFIILVFLGGVIIVVIFITSVCINKKLHLRTPFNPATLVLLIIMSIIVDYTKILNFPFSGISIGSFLYSFDNSLLLIFILITLLIILIAVVIIVKLEEGPLLKRL